MKTEISVEFFPPQTTEGLEKLRATRQKLTALKPGFFSVTYGAAALHVSAPFALWKK